MIKRMAWLLPMAFLASCGMQHAEIKNQVSDNQMRFSPYETNVQRDDEYVVPATEFATKWNALAENAMMTAFRLKPEDVRIDLGNGTLAYKEEGRIWMEGSLDQEGFLTNLTLVTSETDPYKILPYWALVLGVTNTDVLPNEVDAHFRKLGIEADGVIQSSLGRSVRVHHATYRIIERDGKIRFTYAKERDFHMNEDPT